MRDPRDDVDDVVLWTLQDAHRARSFYEKVGFRLTGREKREPLSNWLTGEAVEQHRRPVREGASESGGEHGERGGVGDALEVDLDPHAHTRTFSGSTSTRLVMTRGPSARSTSATTSGSRWRSDREWCWRSTVNEYTVPKPDASSHSTGPRHVMQCARGYSCV